MEVDFREFPNQNPIKSTVLKESIRPNIQDHKKIGISFSQQLKDIDEDLGIYEDPLILAQSEEVQPNQENSQLFDLDMLKKKLDDNLCMSLAPTLVPPLENNPVIPLSDITNS